MRVKLDIADDPVHGPFSTVDAMAIVGKSQMELFSKKGMIFWADHTKLYYYAFQEIQENHKDSTSWSYDTPLVDGDVSAYYGRVRIYKYGTSDVKYVIKDTFTHELYIAFDLRTAFEIAVMVVHFFPNERVLPDIRNERLPDLPRPYPTQADYGIGSSAEMNVVWVESEKAPVSTKRSIQISLADAISILNGDKPSVEMLSNLCATFPTALIAANGVPLVVYNTRTTVLAVAQSITTLGLAHGILSSDAIDSFVNDKMVGEYKIVGGWGYDYLDSAQKSRDRVAVIDLALSHSSSPSMLEINLANLTA
jgi:hypothetical protein